MKSCNDRAVARCCPCKPASSVTRHGRDARPDRPRSITQQNGDDVIGRPSDGTAGPSGRVDQHSYDVLTARPSSNPTSGGFRGPGSVASVSRDTVMIAGLDSYSGTTSELNS
jgi:hypothetical protein